MSQKIKERNDNYVIIELKLIINFELISLLFSHADGITILEPSSLAVTLKNKAKALYENYF
jgi:predicted DNA-binding transcriptional regulator YafY